LTNAFHILIHAYFDISSSCHFFSIPGSRVYPPFERMFPSSAVDHQGVSNGQLVAERSQIALAYDNKSPAEQRSVAIAWDLLMRREYGDLRACLFANPSELKRFS
jgi:hypothetical protein